MKEHFPVKQTLWKGCLLALIGTLAFSAKAIVAKLAYRYGTDTITLLTYRMIFSLPFFLLLLWWGQRSKMSIEGRKQRALGISHQDWLAIFALGFTGYYLASFLDFWALNYISVTLERLILYLSPAFVLVFNVLYLRQRIRLLQWLGVLISYVGIVIVFGYETLHVDNTTETAFGLLLVFGSTLSYSCYLVMSADIVKRIGVAKLTGLASSVACIFCITHFLLTKPISALQVAPEALKLSLFNAFFCTVIPVFFIMSAIKCLGPALTAQIGMLGAISTIILGHFILGETAGQATWLGTTLVLLGIYMVTRSKKDKVMYENKQKKPKH